MPELSPEQALLLRDLAYLPSVKNEHQLTISVLSAIPADQGNFRPDPVSRPALDLAWHIVAAELGFLTAVGRGAFEQAPWPRPAEINNSAALVDLYRQEFASRIQTVTEATGEQLAKIVPFRNILQLPAVTYLSFIISHSVHHRGQLTTYLRPMGAKVPNIYGESFDGKLARESAATN